jgi:hypothetical protein
MGLSDVESIRQLISAAVRVQERRDIEQDQHGPVPVHILSRPKFAELEQFAIDNPGILVALFPMLELFRERLIVCQALARATDHSLIPFWIGLIEHEHQEELLACAAIALARWGQSDPLARLEARSRGTASLRLIFYLGIARLLLEDARGVDHLIEMLQREANGDLRTLAMLPTNGPTMRFVALSLLKRLFPKGPGEDIAEWVPWWEQHRNQHQSIDCSALSPQELDYMAPISVFLEGSSTTEC